MDVVWPLDAAALAAEQTRLAGLAPEPWRPADRPLAIGACFICFPRPSLGRGERGDPAWAAAAWSRGHRMEEVQTVGGRAGAPYEPGLLALREGPTLEAAVRALSRVPDVLLVNATARDHPRGAGLALHLGARLDVPTVGVTHRPLLASGPEPGDVRGAWSPLAIGDEVVGRWVRTRPGRRPLAVDPGWRLDTDAAVEVVMAAVRRARTPEPLRAARRAARRARAGLPPAGENGL